MCGYILYVIFNWKVIKKFSNILFRKVEILKKLKCSGFCFFIFMIDLFDFFSFDLLKCFEVKVIKNVVEVIIVIF